MLRGGQRARLTRAAGLAGVFALCVGRGGIEGRRRRGGESEYRNDGFAV